MNTKKIKLSEIKVKSFITAIPSENSHIIKGGTSEDTTGSRYGSGPLAYCTNYCTVILHKN